MTSASYIVRRNPRKSLVPLLPANGHTVGMTQIRLVVLEGQRTLADALAWRLASEPDLTLVAVTDSAAAVHRLIDGHHVDIVLLDRELQQSLSIAAELARSRGVISQPVRVIMLGTVPEAVRTVQALRSGIVGWVPKEESVEQLLRVIRGAMRDETWLPAGAVSPVLRLLLHERDEREASAKHPLASLTPREREVLAYLAEGIGRREAADRMQLSAHTVRSHLQNLMAKLGVHTTLEAVAVARQAQHAERHRRATSLS
jgi:DNA-binding NarL/FixJ family response regulator